MYCLEVGEKKKTGDAPGDDGALVDSDDEMKTCEYHLGSSNIELNNAAKDGDADEEEGVVAAQSGKIYSMAYSISFVLAPSPNTFQPHLHLVLLYCSPLHSVRITLELHSVQKRANAEMQSVQLVLSMVCLCSQSLRWE